jgi:hypothetical protein
VPACQQRGLKEDTQKISCQSKSGHESRSPDQLRKSGIRELEESTSSEPRVTDRMVEVRLESSAEPAASLTVSSERIGQLSNTDVLGRHSIIFSFCTREILKYFLAVIFGVFFIYLQFIPLMILFDLSSVVEPEPEPEPEP